MWLARSLPPLLSHLRHPAASARRRSTLLGGSSSRTYTSSDDEGLNQDPTHGSTAAAAREWPSSPSSKRPDFCSCCGSNQLLQPRGHLYLALDDWKHGFSIHKLSLDDLLGGGGGNGGGLQRLPEPLFRLRFPMVGSYPCFHALGTNIVVTSNYDRYGAEIDSGAPGVTLVYDTETAALDMENSLPHELSFSDIVSFHAVAAGGRLYAFDSNKDVVGVPYLRTTDSTISSYLEDDDEPYCGRPQRRWMWERSPKPPPFRQSHCLDERSYVSATALHPDGRTIYVSVRSSCLSDDTEQETGEEEEEDLDIKSEEEEQLDTESSRLGTFSLDTETGEWTRHGSWHLPFNGEAHFDSELGAWVGTHTVACYEHLCSCDVPGEPMTGAPEWKLAREELTFLEAPLQMKGRCLEGSQCVLLHTGGGMFCRVEPALREGVSDDQRLGGGDKWVLRMTMFRAKYGKDGELVAAPILPGRSYLMSRYLYDFHARAFWI